MTLNPDFVLNCVLRQNVWSSESLKRGRFRSLASLILAVNVVGELQPKRTLAVSRGFLAAAWLSCSRYRRIYSKTACFPHPILV